MSRKRKRKAAEPERVHIPMILTSPVQDHLAGFCEENRRQASPIKVIQRDGFRGRTLALCGAGPSLADLFEKNTPGRDADEVWGCNSAVTHLHAQGARVTAGAAIDQTPMLLQEWADPPPVPYYLASTVHPSVVRHLQALGREIFFFHSLVGFENEIQAYRRWPSTFMSFRGYTVVGRMLTAAVWMGFEHVWVYGADGAFGPGDVTHADGTSADDAYGGNVMVFEADIDGKHWRTRADMLMATVDLVRYARIWPDRITLVGDTLPNALMEKDEAFLDEVCRVMTPDECAARATANAP